MARDGPNRSPFLHTLLIISSFLLLVFQIHGRTLENKIGRAPITAKGLSYDYYLESCPSVEMIVRKNLEEVFAKDVAIAAGFLHLFFHDCIAGGCDASILLHGQDGELSVVQNSGGFSDDLLYTIDNLRALIHKQCQRTVSCADIVTLGSREAVYLLGGPYFDVPLGRRDSVTFNLSAPSVLPFADNTTDGILETFASKNFDYTDVVALSGAHTIGSAHCGALVNRLTDFDPPIESEFKSLLTSRCVNKDRATFLFLDVSTPYKFDNMYYVNLVHNQGALTSDQKLSFDSRTKDAVYKFAYSQNSFFERFASVFVKMSQMDVLTGNEGEIRKSCFATNSELSSTFMIKEVVESVQKI